MTHEEKMPYVLAGMLLTISLMCMACGSTQEAAALPDDANENIQDEGELYEEKMRGSGSSKPIKMTDAELSKKLGHYQAMSVIWFWVGVVGAVSGAICYFVVPNKALKSLLVTVLFSGGIFCAIFLSEGAHKKLKALMQEQMGDFFRQEWEKAFGPDIHTQEMRIDEPFMRALHLLDGKWEECTVENFHEGDHGGIHFSAANVQLDHVYQRGCSHDGYETCRKMVFKGIVLRSRTWVPVPSPVLVNVRTEENPRGILTGNDTFDRSFCIAANSKQDAACRLTPRFIDFLTMFDRDAEGQILSFCWEGKIFSLVLEMDFGIAAIASSVDLSDLDAARRSYIRSLEELGSVLDRMITGPALTDVVEREEYGRTENENENDR